MAVYPLHCGACQQGFGNLLRFRRDGSRRMIDDGLPKGFTYIHARTNTKSLTFHTCAAFSVSHRILCFVLDYWNVPRHCGRGMYLFWARGLVFCHCGTLGIICCRIRLVSASVGCLEKEGWVEQSLNRKLLWNRQKRRIGLSAYAVIEWNFYSSSLVSLPLSCEEWRQNKKSSMQLRFMWMSACHTASFVEAQKADSHNILYPRFFFYHSPLVTLPPTCTLDSSVFFETYLHCSW